jgi:hypothetical protein
MGRGVGLFTMWLEVCADAGHSRDVIGRSTKVPIWLPKSACDLGSAPNVPGLLPNDASIFIFEH